MLHREIVIIDDCITPSQHLEELYPDPKYTQIGSGAYASVLFNDERSDEVLKVVCAADYGYLGWMEVIQELGNNNPYLPRIYEVTQYQWHPDSVHYKCGLSPNINAGFTCEDRFVVRMEKLTHLRQTGRAIRYGLWLEDAMIPFSTTLNNMTNAKRIEACIMLQICREQTRAYPDLHSGNYMMRKGGQVVITDPFS